MSALIAEETRLKTIAANSPLSQHSVLAVPPLPIQAAGPAKTPCSHCGRTNHPDVRCIKKYPHLLAEMKSMLPRDVGQLQLLLTAFKQQLHSTRNPAIAASPLLHSVDTCQPAPCLLHHTEELLVGC
jgi:hypothetical protein